MKDEDNFMIQMHKDAYTQLPDEVGSSGSNDLLCVVSPHEKGFWQADVYEKGCDEEGVPPTWYATGKIGEDRYSVMSKASKAFPGINFIAGVTGYCANCSEQYFELEKHCECGESLSEP